MPVRVAAFDPALLPTGLRLLQFFDLTTGPLDDRIEELIRAGNHQILRFFARVRVQYVDEELLRTYDRELRFLANVNRPQDLQSTGQGGGPIS